MGYKKSIDCCCKDCTKRIVGCHGKCKDYKEYKEEIDKHKKEIEEYIKLKKNTYKNRESSRRRNTRNSNGIRLYNRGK